MSRFADVRTDGTRSSPSETHPLIKDRLTRPRTVFHPGSRIKMNVLPMIMNLFIPWGIFTFVSGICSSWVMYSQPGMVWTFMLLLYGGWLLTLRTAVEARRSNAEPTWFTYAALTVGAAVIGGTVCGVSNFNRYRRPFYRIRDLKVVKDLDASREYGQNWMDAGILEFKEGGRLDGLRSWHFRHGSLYCVAPVTMNGSRPETQSYDFWAVGQDCCSATASDFRCGAWAAADARKAIRVIDDEAAPFYRLAVKQAETMYGIVASHPVFFRWSRDPQAEVAMWNQKAFSNYAFMVCVAFVCSLALLALASCQFAFIGRGGKTEMYNDPYWNSDMYQPTPAGPSVASATALGTGMAVDPAAQRYNGV